MFAKYIEASEFKDLISDIINSSLTKILVFLDISFGIRHIEASVD